MRRFELDGDPRRFWEVELLGARVQMKWGAVGAPPQAFSRGFVSEAEAEQFAERQVIAQRERGYIEIDVPPAAAAREVTVERHQRFEWKSQGVRRFVEITQEGAKLTVRGGRILDGRDVPDREQLHVRHLPSIAAASAAFDERCADVRYQGGHPVEPEPAHAVHANPVLEAECEASRDAADAWAVYADWLIAHGDIRGEIAALQAAGRAAEARRLLGTHLRELCGTDTGKLAFEFRHGFAVHCSISVDRDGDDLLEDVTRMVLASPIGRFLESLRFGLAGQGDENDWGPTLHAVASSPRAAHVRALRFDLYDYLVSELSWTPFGDFTGVWPKLPALELLHIRSGAGGTLGELDLPNLVTFIRESGGLAQAELDAIVAARWPRLAHLELWFGSRMYGAEGELASIRPILAGGRLPALRHLGLVNCEFIEDAIPELARSAILPRLESLDLSKGVLARRGADALVAHAPAFRHLAAIDLDANFLSDSDLARLRDVLDNVVPGKQRERDEDDDEDDDDRYAAVGE